MDVILAIAKKHKLYVIEDCCEAHGATLNGKVIGSFGNMGLFSFYAAHMICSGEGGMIKQRIYFIASEGRIKVGVTRNVKSRIASFNTNNGAPIELIGTIDGDVEMERAIHYRLREFNLKGEWFKDCAEVRSLMEFLIAKGPIFYGLPDKKGVTANASSSTAEGHRLSQGNRNDGAHGS